MEHLPPGFRFYPTEEELISFYLHNKLHYQESEIDRVIPSIDIYNFEPSQLPEQASKLFQKESEQWFFFTPQQEREARGGRPNRTTETGYWKATGSPSCVYSSNNNKVIGVKKTMVFYKGKAPYGTKTKWKMNEYKAINQVDNNNNNNCSIHNVSSFCSTTIIPKLRQEISLCRVYVTSGCARAFDRRPHAGSTTTTITTTLSDNIEVEVGQGNEKHEQNAQTCLNKIVLTTSLDDEKSYWSLDNSNNNNSCGDDDNNNVAPQIEPNNSNRIDFDMSESLDSLIDWEQVTKNVLT